MKSKDKLRIEQESCGEPLGYMEQSGSHHCSATLFCNSYCKYPVCNWKYKMLLALVPEWENGHPKQFPCLQKPTD